jgi:hypothetical protein
MGNTKIPMSPGLERLLAKVREGSALTDDEAQALMVVHDVSPETLQGHATEAEIEAALKPAPSSPGPPTSSTAGSPTRETLLIHSSMWTRAMWAGLGGLTGVLFGIFTFVGYRQEGFSYSTLILLAFTAFGAASALLGSRPKWIKVDGQSLTFSPEVGNPRVFARSSIGRMTMQSGRYGPSVRFLDKDGKKLFAAGMGFEQSDLKNVAKLLGVRLL